MKIALVCKKFSLEVGGLERYTVNLSRQLLRLGHEVHVFSNRFDEEPGILFHYVPMFRYSSPGKNLSFAYFSKQALSKENFDIIHSMERIWYQDIFRVSDGINPVQMQQRYPNPLLRKLKAAGPRRQVLRYLEKRIFLGNGCRCIMTNSELVKDQIIKHYGVDTQKIHVVHNSVDTVRFHPGVKKKFRSSFRTKLGVKEADQVILFVSNDFKLKRLHFILQAMALLKDKTVKLLVAGNDNQMPYKKWAANHHLNDQVLFLGSSKTIEQCYAAADIFILPTLYDAFANVCLEAMACGLPVITTPTNGAARIITDGKHGYILNTLSPDELKNKIQILSSPAKRSQMGEQAAAKAKDFTTEKHMKEVLNLYAEFRHNEKNAG